MTDEADLKLIKSGSSTIIPKNKCVPAFIAVFQPLQKIISFKTFKHWDICFKNDHRFDFSSGSAHCLSYCVPEQSDCVTQEACIHREFRVFLQNLISCSAGKKSKS